jgi:hypothetical protein
VHGDEHFVAYLRKADRRASKKARIRKAAEERKRQLDAGEVVLSDLPGSDEIPTSDDSDDYF